jgi:hypothetical protein
VHGARGAPSWEEREVRGARGAPPWEDPELHCARGDLPGPSEARADKMTTSDSVGQGARARVAGERQGDSTRQRGAKARRVGMQVVRRLPAELAKRLYQCSNRAHASLVQSALRHVDLRFNLRHGNLSEVVRDDQGPIG